MAIIKNNLFVKGASGTVGKQLVYRNHGDNTVIATMPTIDPNAVPTEEQAEHRTRFSDGTSYAKEILADPDMKAEYAKVAPKGQSAYNMAVRDFFKPPVIRKINAAGYDGSVGSRIIVHAKDDFRVAAVKVLILSASGEVLEQGDAIPNSVNQEQWTYTATVANNALADTIVQAIATDVPGNTATLELPV